MEPATLSEPSESSGSVQPSLLSLDELPFPLLELNQPAL